MKSEVIHPEEDRYDFSLADEFVKFGEDNGMFIIGHCLVWHSQLSPWFCVDAEGKNVSPEVLKERLKSHIHTIVGRYKGRIKGWDVVNEAIEGDGSYRKSKFYEILGERIYPAGSYNVNVMNRETLIDAYHNPENTPTSPSAFPAMRSTSTVSPKSSSAKSSPAHSMRQSNGRPRQLRTVHGRGRRPRPALRRLSARLPAALCLLP